MIRIELAESFNIPVKLVAGLRWETVEPKGFLKAWFNASRSGKTVLVHKVKNEDHEAQAQLGISTSRDGLGELSAGSLFALSNKESTLFAVVPVKVLGRTDVYFWLIGVDQGAIIPGTDIVANEAEISNALHEFVDYGLGDAPTVLAPGCSDKFPGSTDDVPHGEFFDSKYLLKNERVRRLGYRKYIIGLLVFVFSTWGYFEYSAYMEQRRALMVKAQKPIVAKVKKTAEQLQGEAVRLENEMLTKFLSSYDISDITSSVKQIVDDLPYLLNGWILTSIEVKQSSNAGLLTLRIYLSNNGGSSVGLKDALIGNNFDLTFAPNGKLVVGERQFNPGKINIPDLSFSLDSTGQKRISLIDSLNSKRIDFDVSAPKKVIRPEKLPDYLYAPDDYYFIPVSSMAVRASKKGLESFADFGHTLSDSKIAFKFSEISIVPQNQMEWEIKGNLYE